MSEEKPKIIQEYFLEKEDKSGNSHSGELFDSTQEDIELKTEVTDEELRHISVLEYTDNELTKLKIGKVYNGYIEKFLRLKVSLNRQSRKEYVDVNKNKQEETASGLFNKMGLGK